MALATPAALSIAGLLPYKLYAVQTGSMRPTLPPKTAVLVSTHHYQIGQPVTYKKGSELITHRLLAIHPDGTIDTKGDANTTPDPWHVKTTDIIGGVVSSQPQLGYWLVYLKNPLGLASLADTALIIWLIWDLVGANDKDKPNPAATPLSVGPAKRPMLAIDGLLWP